MTWGRWSAASRSRTSGSTTCPARVRRRWATCGSRCSRRARPVPAGGRAVSLPLPLPLRRRWRRERRRRFPPDASWQYEPKWDGFRCLAFRDGDDGASCSPRPGKPLGRYFPEIVEALRGARGAALRARRRDRDPGGRRGSRSTSCCCASTRPRAGCATLARGAPGAAHGLRPAGGRAGPLARRTAAGERRARLEAFAQALLPPRAARSCCRRATRRVAHGADGWLAGGRRRPRRRHRQAARPAVSIRRARRHGEGQAAAHGRLRGRRLPLRVQGRRRRLAAARPVRRRGPARTTWASARSLPTAERAGLTAKLEPLRRAARLHRPSARRPEPLEHRAHRRNGSRSRPSWSSRCGTTTSPAAASATARFLRWRPDKAPAQCRMSQLR